MRPVLTLLLALTACKEAEPEVTFYADVAPILEAHCVRCHSPGGVGAGNFTELDIVRPLAARMADRIEAGEMPPPVADPDCNDYVGSEFLSVQPGAVETLRAWVEAGQPLGDPADQPEVEAPRLHLDEWDLEVLMPVAYTPSFADPSQPGNEYRCFAADHERTEPFFITAMAPVVDQTRLVHHMVVYRLKKDDLPEGYDWSKGVDCIGMTDVGEGMIAGWAPGSVALTFPEGVGLLVKPDEYLVFQMHYFDHGAGTAEDQSGYRFLTTDAVDTVVDMAPIGLYDFEIPAGDPAYTYGDGYPLPAPYYAKVWGVFPHMHVLGSGYEMWIERGGQGGEKECIIGSSRYDFHNQVTYGFAEPITIHSGDYIGMSCTWNNSAENEDQFFDPPRDIRYGERTDEEMCYMFTLLSYGFE